MKNWRLDEKFTLRTVRTALTIDRSPAGLDDLVGELRKTEMFLCSDEERYVRNADCVDLLRGLVTEIEEMIKEGK